jgi:hypothetical protein
LASSSLRHFGWWPTRRPQLRCTLASCITFIMSPATLVVIRGTVITRGYCYRSIGPSQATTSLLSPLKKSKLIPDEPNIVSPPARQFRCEEPCIRASSPTVTIVRAGGAKLLLPLLLSSVTTIGGQGEYIRRGSIGWQGNRPHLTRTSTLNSPMLCSPR